MKYAVPIFSFLAVAFATYVQTKSPTCPEFVKYFMWACFGSVLTSSIIRVKEEYDESQKEKEDETVNDIGN